MLLTTKEKKSFWIKWTILNTLSFIVALVVAYIFLLGFFTNPGYAMGTHFEESRNTILFKSIVGIIISTIQWLLLRKLFKITLLWIVVFPLVIIIVDLIIFNILGHLDINWGEYSDNYPFSIPILIIGEFLLIGFLQSILLGKHFYNTYSWILASSAPWAISLMVTVFSSEEIIWFAYILLGFLLYSVMTGGTLMRIMKPKKT